MTAAQLAGAGGTVAIRGDGADLALYVEPLPFRLELALVDDLRRLAKRQQGDFVKVIEPVLDRLARLKTPEAAARAGVVLQTAATMEARQELPGDDATEAARRTPAGVALELWHRGRRANPAIALRELEAVVTDANALDLHLQIREALGSAADPKS